MSNAAAGLIAQRACPQNMSIPRKIHYCWFGKKPLPALYARCVESWSRAMPDYELVRWDETNTDLESEFLSTMLKKRRWAFVSDYIRLRVLHDQGGIYLDADVEAVKPFDPLLEEGGCFLGYEAHGRLTSGVMGAVRGHPFLASCMALMDERHRSRKPYLIAPEVISAVASRYTSSDLRKLPPSYFYPYNPYDHSRSTSVLMFADITNETFAIHHWGKGWTQGLLQRVLKKLA